MPEQSQALTSGPILNHLIRLSIPASMGMIFNTLYNLTDFWFAGKWSDEALAGVSIAGSVFFLLLAFGIGIQTGASAVIAPVAGKKDWPKVADLVDHVVGLSLLLTAAVMIMGFFAVEPLVQFLGAEPHIEPLALEYVWITLAGTVAFVLSFAAAGALMALGDTKSNRNALAIGFFANFILNPALTFGLGLGVTGLALSTVIIKALSAWYLFWILSKRLGRWTKPRFGFDKLTELCKQVVPASMNMLTIIMGSFITVSYIGRFGSDNVAGYAVGLRLEQILLLPALGLNSAVMGIAGQNFGAEKFSRVAQTYRKALLVGLFMAVISIPIMVFLSPSLMSFFSDSQTIINTGAQYLRIDAIAFYAYVVLFLSVAILQSLKQPLFPMFLGIARQLVVPAIVNYFLIVVWGYPMISVFYTIISVVVISAIVAHWYTLRQLKLLSATTP